MVLIETKIFTRRIRLFLADDEYREFQSELAARPEMGKIISGSGGLRKVRWSASGEGKRGGVRIIYYWLTARDTILLLFVYSKHEKDDLTNNQIKQLRKLIDEDYL